MAYRVLLGDGPAHFANDQPSDESAHLRARVRRRAELRELVIAWGAVAMPLAAVTAALVVWVTQ